jgi:hypothetical protein
VNAAGNVPNELLRREQPPNAPIRAEGASRAKIRRDRGVGVVEGKGARVSILSIALFFALVLGNRLTSD